MSLTAAGTPAGVVQDFLKFVALTAEGTLVEPFTRVGWVGDKISPQPNATHGQAVQRMLSHDAHAANLHKGEIFPR